MRASAECSGAAAIGAGMRGRSVFGGMEQAVSSAGDDMRGGDTRGEQATGSRSCLAALRVEIAASALPIDFSAPRTSRTGGKAER